MLASASRRRRLLGLVGLMVCLAGIGGTARAGSAYASINPTMTARTIVLNGHDLSIDDVVAVARYGARVELSPDAVRRHLG